MLRKNEGKKKSCMFKRGYIPCISWLHEFHFHVSERLRQVEPPNRSRPPLPLAVLSLQTPSIETTLDMNSQTSANIVPCTELRSPGGATRSDVHRIKSCLGELITPLLVWPGFFFFKAACRPSPLLALYFRHTDTLFMVH